MADSFTTSTRIGFGNRFIKSILGIPIGFLLIIASIGLLYWNEGRFDTSKLAVKSVVISATEKNTDPGLVGKLVSVTGKVEADNTLGDSPYISAGNYLALNRIVEMYAWIEDKNTKTQSNLGGSQTQTTTYSYRQGWTSSPVSSSNFAHPEGHTNPPLSISSEELRASGARVGAYAISNFQNIELPSGQRLTTKAGDYIYMAKGGGNIDAPKVGDVRISYTDVPAGVEYTVMGQLDSNSISSFRDKSGNRIFRIFSGDRNDAISQLHTEYTAGKWLFRAVGFLTMTIGFAMIAGPIATFLDIVPIAGSIGSGIIFMISLVISFILSAITILVSMILHNLIAVGVIVVIAIIALIAWFKKRKKTT